MGARPPRPHRKEGWTSLMGSPSLHSTRPRPPGLHQPRGQSCPQHDTRHSTCGQAGSHMLCQVFAPQLRLGSSGCSASLGSEPALRKHPDHSPDVTCPGSSQPAASPGPRLHPTSLAALPSEGNERTQSMAPTLSCRQPLWPGSNGPALPCSVPGRALPAPGPRLACVLRWPFQGLLQTEKSFSTRGGDTWLHLPEKGRLLFVKCSVLSNKTVIVCSGQTDRTTAN